MVIVILVILVACIILSSIMMRRESLRREYDHERRQERFDMSSEKNDEVSNSSTGRIETTKAQ